MTQMGRYSGMTKKSMKNYAIIQDTHFPLGVHRTAPARQERLSLSKLTCILNRICKMTWHRIFSASASGPAFYMHFAGMISNQGALRSNRTCGITETKLDTPLRSPVDPL